MSASPRLRRRCVLNPSKADVACLDGDRMVSFLPMEDVGFGSPTGPGEPRPLADVYQGFTYFADGDVLVAKITPSFENGKGGVAEGLIGGIGFGTTELHVLRPHGIDARYLGWLVQSREFRQGGAVTMTGAAGQQRVPEDYIADFPIPITQQPTQRRIAHFLDRETERIDALIDKKRRLIDLLEEKRTATVTDAVTKGLNPTAPRKPSGIPWIGEIPAHWEVLPIRTLAGDDQPLVDGDWIELPHIQDSGIRLIQTGNIGVGVYVEQGFRYVSEGSFVALNCTEVQPGDVLTCRLAEPVGRACVAPDLGTRMMTSVDVAILRPRRSMHADYIAYMLSSARYLSHMDALSRGGTRKRVSRSQLGATRVAIPPAGEQRVIADRLGEVTCTLARTIVTLESQLALLAGYREALITAAVTGDIEVDDHGNTV